MPYITLICIGNEILSGQTQDSNSGFIAKSLQEIGLSVNQIITVSDEPQEIKTQLAQAWQKSDLVISTGGLGPTKDDRSKMVFCDFFNDKLVFSPQVFGALEQLLAKRKLSHLLEKNRGQAMVPSQAKVFINGNGTAPALCFQEAKKMFICLPGVPFEVKHFFRTQLSSFLQENYQSSGLLSRSLWCSKIPESILSEMLESLEMALPKHISLSYLPQYSRVKLVLTATGKSKNELAEELDHHIAHIKPILGKHLISDEADALPAVLKNILQQQELSIATAESCTSGQISRLISSTPGSSAYFLGGVTTYQNHIKSHVLGVDEALILQHGVVSEPVVEAMLKGAKQLFGADVCIATSGVAGPSRGPEDPEIGTVVIGVAIKNHIKIEVLHFKNLDREDFVNYSALKALEMCISELLEI